MAILILGHTEGLGSATSWENWDGSNQSAEVFSQDLWFIQNSCTIDVGPSRALVFSDHIYSPSTQQGVYLRTVDVAANGVPSEPSTLAQLTTDRPIAGRMVKIGNTGKVLLFYTNLTNGNSFDMAVVSVDASGAVIQETAPATFISGSTSKSRLVPLDDSHFFILHSGLNNAESTYAVVEHNNTLNTLTTITGPTDNGIFRDCERMLYGGLNNSGDHMVVAIERGTTTQNASYVTYAINPTTYAVSVFRNQLSWTGIEKNSALWEDYNSWNDGYLGDNVTLFSYTNRTTGQAFVCRLYVNPASGALGFQQQLGLASGIANYPPIIFGTRYDGQWGVFIEDYQFSSYRIYLGYIEATSSSLALVQPFQTNYRWTGDNAYSMYGLDNHTLMAYRDTSNKTGYITTAA